MKSLLRKHMLTVVLLILLAFPLTLQTFQPGFFVGDDGEWMIIRSSAFHEALRDGQFPVRLPGRLNHEYGYPVTTFLYPGYLYLTEPLIIAGFSFVTSVKIMFALTMVSSGIFVYLWLSRLFGRWSALLGALVYLYTPYHLVDMYNRGSLGELLALAVLPFILWQIERKSMVFSALGIAGLILSHNILAALFLPVIFVYTLLSFRTTERSRGISHHKLPLQTSGMRSLHALRLVGMTYGLGLGLSAFFWIPALFELHYTVFNQTKIAEWQNYFASFAQIGGLPLILLLASISVLLFQKHFKHKNAFLALQTPRALIWFFTCIGTLAVLLSSSFSAALWHILPVSFIQFPFRFLSLEIIAVAFIAAFLFDSLRGKIFKNVFFGVIFIALAINAAPYLTSIPSFDKGEGFYSTNQSTTTTRDEYMPVWVKQKPLQRAEEKVVLVNGEGVITNVLLTNKQISFTIDAKTDSLIQLNKIYWPGWKAVVDGNDSTLTYDNPQGVMRVPVSPGTHTVQFLFEETSLRLFADGITLLSGIMLFGIAFFKKHKGRRIKKK